MRDRAKPGESSVVISFIVLCVSSCLKAKAAQDKCFYIMCTKAAIFI